MLRQAFHELTIPTRGRGLCEFTREVEQWVDQNQFQDGLLTIHLQHTSASLLIQENADPDVRRDLEAFFNGWSPTAIRFLCIRSKAMTTCPRTFARRLRRST